MRMFGTIKTYRFTVFALALLFTFVCGFAFGEAKVYMPGKNVLVDGRVVMSGKVACTVCPMAENPVCVCEPVVTTKVVRSRYVRPLYVRPLYVATPKAVVSVERRTPTYTITEEPRDPFVIRGIFTDRVRMPRGKQITVEKQLSGPV